MKIFYILNGSNDLYDSILKNLNEFLEFMKKRVDLEGYCIYKISYCDYLNIWSKNKEKISKSGIYKIKNGIVNKIEFEGFFLEEKIEGKNIRYIDIENFLRVYMKDSDSNVVLISGHGGPFQSLLDISEPIAFSINTYNLASILNRRKIDYLILDMCSMNFIEVIYEILYKGNVENLLTYRSFAPIEGIKIKEIIESIEGNDFKKKFFYLDSLLISLNKENIKELDLFRVKQNKKILGLLNKKDREFKRGIHILRTEGVKIGLQTKRGKALSGDTLGYIKYFLENEYERKIYSRYKYTKNNLWNIIVRAEFKVYDEEINIIKLENTGLLNIIMTYVKEEEAVKLVEEYLREKEEYIKP